MPQVKINAVLQARMIRMLLDGPVSCYDIADETGLHVVTVQSYTRELKRAGAAHISMWEKDARGRDLIKCYTLGAGRDATRAKLTPSERQRRYRAKQRMAQQLGVVA